MRKNVTHVREAKHSFRAGPQKMAIEVLPPTGKAVSAHSRKKKGESKFRSLGLRDQIAPPYACSRPLDSVPQNRTTYVLSQTRAGSADGQMYFKETRTTKSVSR